MSPSVHIRDAEPGDLEALLELYRQLNPDDPRPADARQSFDVMLTHPGMKVLVALADATAVATVTLVIVPNLTRGGAPYALIENVVSHAEHRQKGYAGALIRQAIDRAWQAGCYKVMLLTGSKEPATHRFYENCGFIQNKTGYQIRRP